MNWCIGSILPDSAATPENPWRLLPVQQKRPHSFGRSLEILMIFLKATMIPRKRKTSRSQGDVLKRQSKNQPINAPPAIPPTSSASTRLPRHDRKSDVKGKSVSGRVDLGGPRIIKKQKSTNK